MPNVVRFFLVSVILLAMSVVTLHSIVARINRRDWMPFGSILASLSFIACSITLIMTGIALCGVLWWVCFEVVLEY